MKVILWLVLIFLGSILVAGCSMVGVRTSKEPSYVIEEQIGVVEIRRYAPMVIVETIVKAPYSEASDIAFNRLFKYISGNNSLKNTIPMTAPVEMAPAKPSESTLSGVTAFFADETTNGWRMSFVLPSDISFEGAPVPLDSTLSLKSIPEKLVAAWRYSGFWGPESFQTNQNALLKALDESAIEYDRQTLRAAAFDPPWTLPFLRRNEVHVDVRPPR